VCALTKGAVELNGDLYNKWLCAGKQAGQFRTFTEYFKEPAIGSILLRHDYDCLYTGGFDSAQKMLDVEVGHGIKSSWFFAVTLGYNIFSNSGIETLEKIKESGGEIGLHYNPRSKLSLMEQANVLLPLIGDFGTASIHNADINTPTGCYNSTYDSRVFNDSTYLSDSVEDPLKPDGREQFRGKDPFQWLERAKENYIQVLFHPELWSLGS